MESFSLLKFWRGGGGAALAAAAATAAASVRSTTVPAAATTVATSVLDPSAETDDDDGDGGDDGPFFDLEFAVPEDDGEGEEEGEEEEGGVEKDGSVVAVEAESADEEEEREFNFAVSSEGSCGGSLRSGPLSPSDDLFFKGKLVPLEPSSIVITSSEADPKPQFAVSLLKSATKFRVFMLGLRKTKSAPVEPNGAPAAPTAAAATAVVSASPKQQSQPQQSRFFIRFKVEEVPIVSLFTRDNSSRNSSGSKAAKPQAEDSAAAPSTAAVEEKKFSKEVVQKYLNKIKPLYVRVSKKYAEKLRFSGQLTSGGAAPKNEGEETDAEAEAAAPPQSATAGTVSTEKSQKVNVPAGFKVVCKRLGKSRSASAAVAAVPSPPPQRRDDSLLQLQDGIQSAIAHCKRSFNAAKGSESPLVRSKSDPGDGRSDKSDCV